MTMRELRPVDGRKSFYGKAKVLTDERGIETLYSYDTPIMKRVGGICLRLYAESPTATTLRHVKAFCGLDKKGFEKLKIARMEGA